MSFKNTSFFVLIVSFTFSLQAQQMTTQALFKHHFNVINPAVVGTQNGTYASFTSRNQWASLDGAPKTKAFSLGIPHGEKRVGLGLSIVNDQFNIEKQTYVAADFSYRLPMGRNSNLYLGLKAGYNAYRLDFSDQKIFNGDGRVTDVALENYSSILPNIGTGVYFKSNKSFISISVPRLLNTERKKRQDGMQVTATDRPHLYMSAGTALPISTNFSLHPSALFSAVEGSPSQIILDVGVRFQELIETSIQYSDTFGTGVTALMRFKNGMTFGYAYLTPNASKVNYASHEFIVKIRLKAENIPAENSIEFQNESINNSN